MTLLSVLTMAAVMDFQNGKVSNRLIVLGWTAGLWFRILGQGAIGIVQFLICSSIPVILLYFLFQLRALGAGDIKLFSVVGGFVTLRQLLFIVAASFLAGAVIGVGKIICRRASQGYVRRERTLIHFSIAILIGYLLIVWGCAIDEI